jgi:MFS family permease
MQTVAVAAYVANETSSNTWAAIVAAAGFLPTGLFSIFGGNIADRYNPRRVVIALSLGECAIAASTAALVASGYDSPARVAVLVFLLGSLEALRLPSAVSLLPKLVPVDQIPAATAISSVQYNLGRVVGPALAGAALTAGGYQFALSLNALSFLAPIAAYLFIKINLDRSVRSTLSARQRIVEGWRVAMANPASRVALGVTALSMLFYSPFIAFVALRAQGIVGIGDTKGVDQLTALFTVAQGAGSVLGALALPTQLHHWGRTKTMRVHIAAVPLWIIGYVAAPNAASAATLLGLVGFSYLSILTTCSSTIQIVTADAYRGRVLALWFGSIGLLYPLSSLLMGPAADLIGLPWCLSVMAIAGVAIISGLDATGKLRLADIDTNTPSAAHEPAAEVAREAAEAPIPPDFGTR